MKGKRIAFLIRNMERPAGAERVLAIIANGLSERGYHVSIISLEGMGPSFFALENTVNVYWMDNVKCFRRNIKWLMLCEKIYWIRNFIERDSSDYLIDIDIMNSYISFFVKMTVPDIYWIVWECMNFHFCSRTSKVFNCWRAFLKKIISMNADQLLVLTEQDKIDYQTNMKLRCDITQIYNPLPFEEEFSKLKEKKVILAIGRLADEKGFDLLIRSWKILEGDYPDWMVLIVGEGEEHKKLKIQMKNEGIRNLRIIRNTHSVERLYAMAAFFVLPSRNEPFGMVMIEAMHYSLPVVSYDCKSGPREIITNGENGFLVEPGDIKDFAKKMKILMCDKKLRRYMGKNAQKSVERFEKERILDQWEYMLKLY